MATGQDIKNLAYQNLFNGAAYLNATGQFSLDGIYSNGSSLFLTDDLLDQDGNSFEGLFDGTGTTFNIASGQVQGELDVYFLSGGMGGISTTGQVVATTGLQVLGGTSSFDGGLIATDGAGGLTAEGSVDLADHYFIIDATTGFIDSAQGYFPFRQIVEAQVGLSVQNGLNFDDAVGDVSGCSVLGSPLSGLYDSSGVLNVYTVTWAANISALQADGSVSATGFASPASGGGIVVDSTNLLLKDFGPTTSVDWLERNLIAADGSTIILDWSSVAAFAGSIKTTIPSTGGAFSGTGTATTAFSVTFGTAQADTNYTIGVTPRNTLSSAAFNVSAKSTTGFTVTYLTGLTGTVAFDWALTRW